MIRIDDLINCYSAPVIGNLNCGPKNLISDVSGVTVGHCTISSDDSKTIRTGVTVIKPSDARDLFANKVPAAVSVINGFGKSYGLVQLEELGVLETPIALTNTFSVPEIATAQIKSAIEVNAEIGRSLPTVNPLVLECNDGYLNDIQSFAVKEEHYLKALSDCSSTFEQGAVGAGHGMKCFGFKGGVGSASRISVCSNSYIVGSLVLSNFGALTNLRIGGLELGELLDSKNLNIQLEKFEQVKAEDEDKGSIIMVLATDAPLDSRQLKRLSLRAAAGLARTGSNFGHGSGDISVAFSTAYSVEQSNNQVLNKSIATLNEGQINYLFDAAAEATEQAIINSLWHSKTTYGRDGHVCRNLFDVIKERFFDMESK